MTELERLRTLLDEAYADIDRLESELDALRKKFDVEPCAVCMMRPALPSKKVCEVCR